MTNQSLIDDSLYYLHDSSIKRLTEEVIIVQQSSDEFILTSSQKTLIAWVPRVGGIITCICSLCTLVMAWKRRCRLVHRLVLGMSLHLLLNSIFSMWGVAAIPSGEINAMGNVGNISTCTLQGFVLYMCTTTALFYYCSLSVYSFVGILNNFEENKIGWIEKYIHVLVHIYPIGSALYILSHQSFNAVSHGFCSIGSAPLGCIYQDDVPCERGPQTLFGLRRMELFFLVLPNIFELLLPTTVMVILHYMIKHRQDKIFINVAIFTKQAVIYLFALYWTVLPFLGIAVLHLAAPDKNDVFFSFFAFAQLNFSLFALWAMLSYFFFSIEKKTVSSTTNTTSNDTTTEHRRISNNFLFSSQEMTIEKRPSPTPPPPQQQQRKYSFNIFDGTNASCHFADFVHDGDSEDEIYDSGLTKHWADVQDHV